MKFSHLGDCHLGGWRQSELRELNFRSFQTAVQKSIKEKVDFMLITGDLFDTAYPPIETLKKAFDEFRKIREANIPVFLIAGSHDYSVSGKTFLEVLEKAGFCKNVARYEEKDGSIILEPTIYKNVAMYGYPGKKSALEVDEIARLKLQLSPGLFNILLLHTTIRDAVGDSPIKAVNEKYLPKVDYLALSHLHINYNRESRVYSGPIFPNNLAELEELQGGSFYIFDNGRITRQEIKLKEVISIRLEITNALTATERILDALSKKELKDKIIIIRLFGILESGKTSDINFQEIERYTHDKGAYTFLKSTSKLHLPEPEIKMDTFDSEQLEAQIIRKFEDAHPSKFNLFVPDMIRSLLTEKLEDETSLAFSDRLITESRRILQNEI